MQLEGAVALITGAGSGIGRALAQELSRRGCQVLLLGRRAGELSNTRQMLVRPDLAECLPLDLADSEQRGLLAGKVAALTSHLDLLINNAGVVAAGDFATQPEQDWRTMIEVNLWRVGEHKRQQPFQSALGGAPQPKIGVGGTQKFFLVHLRLHRQKLARCHR